LLILCLLEWRPDGLVLSVEEGGLDILVFFETLVG
jgi:hypothetical protein